MSLKSQAMVMIMTLALLLPSMAAQAATRSQAVSLTSTQEASPDAFSVPELPQLPAPDTREELVVAYYGHPNSRYMGIVGRFSVVDLVERVKATAQSYQDLAPDRRVVPAIYLIYGTAQPQGRIGFLSDAKVNEYISYAGSQGVDIILDHQIGIFSLKQAIDRLLPYMKHPHVHMAFDVEWRTAKPMEEIGFITGEELNWIQKYVYDWLQTNEITAHKYIVFHQFKASMVRGASTIVTNYPQVELIHSTSGWGPPDLKRSTHAYNATLTKLPSKGFKLWYYYSDKPGIHYDKPLMKPGDVLALKPLPKMIIYQ